MGRRLKKIKGYKKFQFLLMGYGWEVEKRRIGNSFPGKKGKRHNGKCNFFNLLMFPLLDKNNNSE